MAAADEYERNVGDLERGKKNEIAALQRKLAVIKEGSQTEKHLLTSALDGANHMRRVQVRRPH